MALKATSSSPRPSITKKTTVTSAKGNTKKAAPPSTQSQSRASTADIDDIFQNIKTAKAQVAAAKKKESDGPVIWARQAAPMDDDLGLSRQGAAAQQTYRTIDGLRLYTAEELRIGEGGGTSLCPFDCDCCF